MKRLGIVLSLFVFIITFFGDFVTPSKAFAGAQAFEQAANYDYFQNEGDALFKNSLNSLASIRAARAKISPPPTKILENIDAYVGLVKEAQQTYSTNFAQGKSQSFPPAKNQATALRAAYDNYNGNYSKVNADVFSDPDVNSIRTLLEVSGFKNLIQQADQIDRGLISPGDDKANNLANASNAIENTGDARAASIQEKCSLTNFSLTNCVDVFFTWFVKNTLLQIAGFLLWAAANIFDKSVQMGILRFSDWAPDTLYPIWIIIRQIISLIVVFIGLYLGFMYILGKEEKFERYIPWVVIFGLFVNFSYPLVRTFIDISNIISLNIYASAVGSDVLTGTSSYTAGALIMKSLGLSGLVASATDAGATSMVGSINSVPAALAAVAFVGYSAYIFIRVTVLIIGRTVSLVFLTIASPILLVDAVLPVLGDKAQFLRKVLFEQLAVGPVFMIMLALTLKFLDAFRPVNLGGISGTTETIPVFFNIIMMLTMLHIMIKVTTSVSGTVGEWTTNTMGKVGGFGLGVASGGAGLLARKGLGGLALKARESGWVTKNQDTFLGRRAYDLSNSIANSTFDLRNTAVAGKMNQMGMGMGMGSKLGYEQTEEQKRKDLLARGTRIKTRYERDVYEKDRFGRLKKDKEGKPILLHRKGEVNTSAEAAQTRFIGNAGGAMFMAKDTKDKLREELGEHAEKEAKQNIDLAKKNSAQDVDNYNKIRNRKDEDKDNLGVTEDERKANYLKQLEGELDALKTTDPEMRGNQAQSLLQSINAIKDKNRADEEAFNRSVADVAAKYQRKGEGERAKYLSDQDVKIQDAVKAHIEAQKKVEIAPEDTYREPTNESVGETIRGMNTDKAKGKVESTVRGPSQPMRSASPVDAVDIDLPLDNVETMSFAARMAKRRAAAQESAQKRIEAEVTTNANAAKTNTTSPFSPSSSEPASKPASSSATSSTTNTSGESTDTTSAPVAA